MAGSDKSSVLLFRIPQSENYVEDAWSEVDENEVGMEETEEKGSHKDEEVLGEVSANASEEEQVEMEEAGMFDAGAALYSPGSVHSNDGEQAMEEGNGLVGNEQDDDDAYKSEEGEEERRALDAQLGID